MNFLCLISFVLHNCLTSARFSSTYTQSLNEEGITDNTSDISVRGLGDQIIYLIKFTGLSNRNLLISTFVMPKWAVDPNLWAMDLQSSIDFFQRGSFAYINIYKLNTYHSDIFLKFC